MKRYLSILLVIVALFMLTGCGTDKDAKLFTESDFETQKTYFRTLNGWFIVDKINNKEKITHQKTTLIPQINPCLLSINSSIIYPVSIGEKKYPNKLNIN